MPSDGRPACPELAKLLAKMEGRPGQHRGLLDIYVEWHKSLEVELGRELTNAERIEIARRVAANNAQQGGQYEQEV